MSKGLRVLFVTNYYKPAYIYGGPTRSISILCENLSELGADITVLTTNANGPTVLNVPLGRPVDVDGVNVIYHPFYSDTLHFSRTLHESLVQHIDKQNVDLVVMESLWRYSFEPTTSLCLSQDIPYVVSPRGRLMPWALQNDTFFKKRLYFKFLGRKKVNLANAICCTNPTEADELAVLGLAPPRFVVPNSIEIDKFRTLPSRGKLRHRFNIGDDAIVLLYVGRLNQIKRPDIAIDTLAAARAITEDVHLLFVGPDEQGMQAQLQKQAEEEQCTYHVHFVGLLSGDDMLNAYSDADLLIMPSEVDENFGRAAAEAMAAGLPVLVSNGIPVGRWAADSNAGYQIDCTKRDFCHYVQKLVKDRTKLSEMGTRAAVIAQKEFDAKVVAKTMLSNITSIVETGVPTTIY